MKIILIKKVKGLGEIGDVKEISVGYATNFLIPQGLARQATEQIVSEMKNKVSKKQKQNTKKQEKNKKLAKKLNGVKIIIKAKADKENKTLFGAITASILSKELKKRKYDVPVQLIKLTEPIKKLGFYEVIIDFDFEIKAQIGIKVTPE